MSEARFLGIDFSGGAGPWKASCSKPTVWIAGLEAFRLIELRPVQHLPGEGGPFERLASLLKEGRFRAAAIDAPFSLPAAHMPPGGHTQLLKEISALPDGPDRPFPTGPALIAMAKKIKPLATLKPRRETEKQCSGANPRSTLWWKPRGGAPFAAACLALIARANRPLWPWTDAQGMLVEAFPAAQLRAWDLPHSAYSGEEGKSNRARIVEHLQRDRHLLVEPAFRQEMLRTADALDAVIAAFAGRAAANRRLHFDPPPTWRLEGAIAVHA